jgi:hypothetical protein
VNGDRLTRWTGRVTSKLGRRRARRPVTEAGRLAAGVLRRPRGVALAMIASLVTVASLVSFGESYRGLYLWAHQHGLSGGWAALWPVQVDTFVAVGELSLFVALVDGWSARSRTAGWLVTVAGLAVSVAGNVGHVGGHSLAVRATAAVPPLAAASALAVGLGVLKRVVKRAAEAQDRAGERPADVVPAPVPTDAENAAVIALRATTAAGNGLSQNQLMTRFGLSRAAERRVRQLVSAESNGHALEQD